MKKIKIILFSLLALIVLIAASIFGYITYLEHSTSSQSQQVALQKSTKKVLSKSKVSLSKDDFGQLLAKYIPGVSSGQTSVKFSGDNIQVSGSASNLSGAFSVVPKADSNGNVILDVKKATVNGITLPAKAALGYLNKHYSDLSSQGVAIEPNQSQIVLNMSQITDQGTSHLSADKIDVAKNIFDFTQVTTDNN